MPNQGMQGHGSMPLANAWFLLQSRQSLDPLSSRENGLLLEALRLEEFGLAK